MAVGSCPLQPPRCSAKPGLVCTGSNDRPPGLCQKGWEAGRPLLCGHPTTTRHHLGSLSTCTPTVPPKQCQ